MIKMIQTTDIFTLTLNQWESRPDISYDDLVIAVKNVHQFSYQAAVKAINRYATMRNWLIGFFIVEYQQKGQDRAAYGERLLKNLENTLQTRGLNVTLFQNCRLFYACYPQVADLFEVKIQPAALVKSETVNNQSEIQPTALVNSETDGNTIVSKLSFAHITELVHIKDETCTKAGKKMVEYALAGMDNNLFVSTYLLQLPDKSVLEQFIRDNNVNNAKYNKTEI